MVALALLVLVAGGLPRSPADPLELRGPHSQPSLCVTPTMLVCGPARLGSHLHAWGTGKEDTASPSAWPHPALSAGLPRSNHAFFLSSRWEGLVLIMLYVFYILIMK